MQVETQQNSNQRLGHVDLGQQTGIIGKIRNMPSRHCFITSTEPVRLSQKRFLVFHVLDDSLRNESLFIVFQAEVCLRHSAFERFLLSQMDRASRLADRR